MRNRLLFSAFLLVLALWACGGTPVAPDDVTKDSGIVQDAGVDAGHDAGNMDAGDSGQDQDAGPMDAGTDAGTDAGVDAGQPEYDAGLFGGTWNALSDQSVVHNFAEGYTCTFYRTFPLSNLQESGTWTLDSLNLDVLGLADGGINVIVNGCTNLPIPATQDTTPDGGLPELLLDSSAIVSDSHCTLGFSSGQEMETPSITLTVTQFTAGSLVVEYPNEPNLAAYASIGVKGTTTSIPIQGEGASLTCTSNLIGWIAVSN